MTIAISLLTLDPWTVGGTQTYAAGLVRALAGHGSLDYRVFVSEIAPEAGGELRTVVVPEFPAGRSRLGRIAGLTRATIADGRLRHALGREHASAFHFPLTVMLHASTRLPRRRSTTSSTRHSRSSSRGRSWPGADACTVARSGRRGSSSRSAGTSETTSSSASASREGGCA